MGRHDATVRGRTLANARSFCLERFGKDGAARVAEALSPRAATIFAEPDAGAWYPLATYTEILDTLTRVHGDSETRVMEELGYFAAENDLTKTMQLFLRVATPAFLVRGYAQLWSRYNSSGTWRVHEEGPRRLRAELTGWDSSEAACVSVAAFIERFLQLVGGHAARVTRQRCASRGDPCCEYLLEWQRSP